MISRTIKSLAIGAALTLSLSGCALLAPIATEHPYDPSDGVGVEVAGVDVRNLLLIADKTGGNYNVVFTAVNHGDPATVSLTFVGDNNTEATAKFEVENGRTLFGDPEGEAGYQTVSLGEQEIGSTVKAYISAGSASTEVDVPVLDGTLAEYKPYVVTESTSKK